VRLLSQWVKGVGCAGCVLHIVETLGGGLAEGRLRRLVVHPLVALTTLEGLVKAALREAEVLALLLINSLLPGGMLVLVRKHL